jgi:hypothetical protein
MMSKPTIITHHGLTIRGSHYISCSISKPPFNAIKSIILRIFHYYTWLVVWNMNFIFPYIGNNHPNWLIFFRGVETTNQILYLWNPLIHWNILFHDSTHVPKKCSTHLPGRSEPLNAYIRYPLVNKHSHWKWPFIVDLPSKNGDFP